MKKTISALLGVACLSVFAEQGAAQTRVIDSDGRCFTHEYQDGEIVRLNITTFADLRIEMPFPIYTAKLGGGPLWQATFTRGVRHIWLKAKSEVEQGAVTSLTILDPELNAYDFVIHRVDDPRYTCAKITRSPDLDFMSDLYSFRSPEQREIDALRAQLSAERERYQAGLEMVREHAENVITASHGAIYAGYTWKGQGRGAASEKLASIITSVHDDGLLTFINVTDGTVPVMAVQGEFAGELQMVQVDFNPLLAMYTVTGVYDRLVLTGETGAVEIQRGAKR